MRVTLLIALAACVACAAATATTVESADTISTRPFVDASAYINRVLVTLESDRIDQDSKLRALNERVKAGAKAPQRVHAAISKTQAEIDALDKFRADLGIPKGQVVPTAEALVEATKVRGLPLEAAQSVLRIIANEITLRRNEIESDFANEADDAVRDFYSHLQSQLLTPSIVDATAQLQIVNQMIAERDDKLVGDVMAAAEKVVTAKAKLAASLQSMSAEDDTADDACEARYSVAWCDEQCRGTAFESFGNGAHECRFCFGVCAREGWTASSEGECLTALSTRLEAETSEFPQSCADAEQACAGLSSGDEVEGMDAYTKAVCNDIALKCCANVSVL